MLTLGRRAIDLAVLFLALYALAVVPLGRRTGLEHLRAILRTRAAQDAGKDVARAATRLTQRLLGGTDPAPPAPRGRPAVPPLPRKSPANAELVPASFAGAPDASLTAEGLTVP